MLRTCANSFGECRHRWLRLSFAEGGAVLTNGLDVDGRKAGEQKFALARWSNACMIDTDKESKQYGGISI